MLRGYEYRRLDIHMEEVTRCRCWPANIGCPSQRCFGLGDRVYALAWVCLVNVGYCSGRMGVRDEECEKFRMCREELGYVSSGCCWPLKEISTGSDEIQYRTDVDKARRRKRSTEEY